MKKLLSTLLTLTLFVAGTAAAKAAPLEVGCLDFPPYYHVAQDGTVKSGLYLDMVTKILTKAGVEHTVKGYPAKRLYTNVGDGTTNIWMGTTGVAEYEGKVLVSPKPTSEIHLTAYSIGNEAALPKSLDDLKGKSIITIFGYNYGGTIKFFNDPANNITSEPAQEHEQAFKMLVAGRAPLLIDYEEPATAALASFPVSNVKKSVIKVVPIYINISKSTPNAQELMDKMMKAYDELKAEGKF